MSQTGTIEAGQPKPEIAIASLPDAYTRVRERSQRLCAPLETEDYVIQSMPDVSPTRWHLAHTTWFFETFILAERDPGYEAFDPAFSRLFNSYYNTVGEQFPRPRRGLLSRPTVREVFAYRRHVDEHMVRLLRDTDAVSTDTATRVELGLHHEMQHQELILTDLKHIFSCNPLYPVYSAGGADRDPGAPDVAPIRWIHFEKGIRPMGHTGGGFSYDNEHPAHDQLVHSFDLADRLITNGEYLQFIEDGGYERPELWLSDGWATVQNRAWRAPPYWIKRGGAWHEFTLSGLRPLKLAEPVCHVSYYEADAFARWTGNYLPKESAWETAATDLPVDGHFVEQEEFHPRPAVQPTASGRAPNQRAAGDRSGAHHAAVQRLNAARVAVQYGPPADADVGDLRQMFGDVWEWTCSPYVAYPGYRPQEGALGEYNGKFMVNQMVLRGGSCATSRAHLRHTYRNFFPPDARWQFTGIRLAR